MCKALPLQQHNMWIRNKNTMRTKLQTKIRYSSFFIYMYFIAEAINWFVILFIFRKNKTNENNWIDITVTKPSFHEPFSSGLVAVSIFHRDFCWQMYLFIRVLMIIPWLKINEITNSNTYSKLLALAIFRWEGRVCRVQTHINRDLIRKERHRININILYTELFYFVFRTI